jgi:hypothetical protein
VDVGDHVWAVEQLPGGGLHGATWYVVLSVGDAFCCLGWPTSRAVATFARRDMLFADEGAARRRAAELDVEAGVAE